MRAALVLLLACAQPAAPKPVAIAAPPRAKPVDPLAMIPARYQAVSWFARANAPLFAYLQRIPGGPPACVTDAIAASEGYFQAQLPDTSPSLIVFRGKPDRAKIEACIREVLAGLGAPDARVTPTGALTEIEIGPRTQYLGWATDGTVVENRERAVVEEALARKTSVTDNAGVMAMVARVDRTRPMWMAGTIDYAAGLLGVASRGFFLATDLHVQMGRTFFSIVTLVFATPADAQRAADAIAGAAHNARFSEAVQAQLAQVDAKVRGADLEVNVAPLFAKPELASEMMQAITGSHP